MVDLALKSLFHDKARFLLTLAGVTFAVTLVLSQVGLFLGLLDNASITIERCRADLWVVSKGTPNIDFGHPFSNAYVSRIRSVPGVERADNITVTFLPVVQPTGGEETAIAYAMDDFSAWGLPWDVAQGTLNDLHGPGMFLDSSASKRFGPFAVGDYRESFGRRVRIVGRTRGAVSFTTYPIIFVDSAFIQELLPDLAGGNTTYVVVKLGPNADLEQVRNEIRKRMPYHDVWTKAEWMQRSRRYWVVTTGLGFNIFVTVALGCLVGLIVVAQTLYTSTLEHIQEYGTLKAIGAGNGTIYWMLVKQALVSAALGFVTALAPVLLLQALVPSAGLKLLTPTWLLAVVFIGTVALCLAAAVASFRKISTVDPAIVFRA